MFYDLATFCLICVALFAAGFGFAVSVGSAVGPLGDLLAVGPGVSFVGLPDDA